MSSRVVIWLLCTGAVFLAWSPYAHHNESAASTTSNRTQAPTAPDDTHVLASAAHVTIDHGVHVELRVTNVADHSVELDFPSGLTHDVVILDSLGHSVWRWSDGRMFTQAVRNTLLAANESVTYQVRWNPMGRKGSYTAVALLKSNNHPIEQRAAFTLP
jgi:hypothetical protein